MASKKRIETMTYLNPRSKIKLILAVSALVLATACSSPEERVEKFSKSGLEYLEQGDLGKANVQFQNALKINEEHVPTLIGMSKIAEEKQDFKSLFGILQRIVRLDPSQVESQVNLGKLYLIGSDETAALEQAEKALEHDPDNAGALALKAAVRLKLGDYAGAVELARQVTAKDPAHAEAVTVLATERALNDDDEGALAILDEAIGVNPEIAILQLLRIQILTNLGLEDDVHAAYARLIELHPEQATYRRVYTNKLLNNKEYEQAQEQLEAIVALEPENINAKLDVIRVAFAAQGAAAAEAKLRGYVNAAPENADLKFALIDFLRRENKMDEANALLNDLANSDDQDIALKAKNKTVIVLFQDGEREKAAALVDEILALDERNTEALLKRAGIRIDAENYDAAIVDLRTALDNSPDNADAMVLMANAFERQGSVSFAQSELAKAFDISKRDAKVANTFAKFLLRHDNLARAEEVLVDSLAAHSGDIDNLKLLAAIRLSMQDWRGAEEVAQILEDVEEERDVVNRIRAAAFTGLEDYDRIIETLSAQNENTPLESRPLATLVAAYLRADRIDEAEELLNRIVGADPNNYSARILLAQVYGARKETEKAENILIETAKSAPSRPEAYELLYRYYLRAGQNDKAVALIDEGLSVAPENIALRVFKADALLNAGQLEEALEVYAELIEVRPNDRIIANNFVSLSSDLRSDEASIAKALEIAQILENDDDPYVKDTVGWAHYRAGQHAKAVEFLSEAAESARGNAEILYHLGAAQLAAGDGDQAKINLQNALTAGGDDFRFVREVQELLGRL